MTVAGTRVILVNHLGQLLAASPFDTINGLPVHALVVHAVVVLLPLSAIGAIIIAFVPRWSERFGVLVWIGAFVSTGAAFVAEESGEQLAKRVGFPPVHAELGEQVKYFAFALFVVTLVLWFYDRRTNPRGVLGKIIAAVVILCALAAIVSAFRTGESGAQAVWQSVIK